ncbi:MAG: hypothetical protein ABSE69_03350, partial [Roseiarcus sp.]
LMRNEITSAVEAPHDIGQSVIDLTGAAATAQAETREIAAPAHDPAALPSLPPGPGPEKVEAQASEGAVTHGAGEAVRQGDRG